MALLPHEPPGEPLVATRLKESHREWGEGGVGQAGTGIELDVPLLHVGCGVGAHRAAGRWRPAWTGAGQAPLKSP